MKVVRLTTSRMVEGCGGPDNHRTDGPSFQVQRISHTYQLPPESSTAYLQSYLKQ